MFEEKIKELKKRKRITPKTLGMQTAKNNFYRWADKSDYVIKIGNNYFVA